MLINTEIVKPVVSFIKRTSLGFYRILESTIDPRVSTASTLVESTSYPRAPRAVSLAAGVEPYISSTTPRPQPKFPLTKAKSF